jgi:carbohydrate-selective porin OprB
MRPFVICTVVSASLAPGAVVFGQDAPAPAAVAQPAAAPASGVLNQDGLTGDWAGARTRAKDKGFELASSLTQFYQGVSSGGTGTSSEYNGTAQALLEFDLGTPWFQLTGDLQILRPNRPVADTAVVPAVRLRLVF